SAYLLVKIEPMASSTASETRFSEGISSSPVAWRRASSRSRSAICGSTESSGRFMRSLAEEVSGVIASPRFLRRAGCAKLNSDFIGWSCGMPIPASLVSSTLVRNFRFHLTTQKQGNDKGSFFSFAPKLVIVLRADLQPRSFCYAPTLPRCYLAARGHFIGLLRGSGRRGAKR